MGSLRENVPMWGAGDFEELPGSPNLTMHALTSLSDYSAYLGEGTTVTVFHGVAPRLACAADGLSIPEPRTPIVLWSDSRLHSLEVDQDPHLLPGRRDVRIDAETSYVAWMNTIDPTRHFVRTRLNRQGFSQRFGNLPLGVTVQFIKPPKLKVSSWMNPGTFA